METLTELVAKTWRNIYIVGIDPTQLVRSEIKFRGADEKGRRIRMERWAFAMCVRVCAVCVCLRYV